ncbi:unnamed protein product [Rotaria sp. Silwood1]|nr:unnamed protein product [Rotaria sp. Silwood1]
MTSTTESLFNLYIFSTPNNFRKVKLIVDEGLQFKTQVSPNTCLEDLEIEIATLQDLSMLFALAPYLIRLEACIVRNTPQEFIPQFRMNIIPQVLKEFYIQTIGHQVIPFQSLLRPLLCNIPSIEYVSVSVKSDDPDYADARLWADVVAAMPSLKTFLLGLEIEITLDLFNRYSDNGDAELKSLVFKSFAENFDLSSSFRIYTNNATLFIDSVPYQYTREQSYNTSPEAVHGLCTNPTHLEQPPHNIVGLTMNGEHIPITKNDYLEVIRHFSSITWLSLSSVNVYDQENETTEVLPTSLKLKNLKSLFYFRSTECKVNRILFDQLFYGHKRLEILKMMYGDLIYLLRTTSPSIDGNHIKNLELYCHGADGTVHLKDLYYLTLTFPQLECLSIQVSSSNLIKKNQIEIIEELIKSFRRLRSFRVNCTKGTLKLARSLMKNDQAKFEWLSRINAIGSHLILEPKAIAIWKSVDCSSSFELNPRITSVVHISVRPTSTTRLPLDKKDKKRINPKSATLTTHQSRNRFENSIKKENLFKRSLSATSSVSVTRVRRPLSQFRQKSWKSTDDLNQKFNYVNNYEIDSTIKQHCYTTAKNTITNRTISRNSIKNKELFGTVEDLTNPTHQSHQSSKNKKIKKWLEYCCRCSRRRACASVFCLILLGIIITIILLLNKSKTTAIKPSLIAILRWNTTGITLFGTTGIRGNTSEQFSSPFGLAFDSFEKLYIGDRYNNRIQKCDIRELTCTTIAGQANAVRGTNMSDLNGPTYVYIDSNDNLYIADSDNYRVQFWSYGASYGTTIAGITGSSGSTLNKFSIPYGVTLDSNSNAVYIADFNNHRVMKYLSSSSSGTIAAGGNGFGTNNTKLYRPAGLYFDSSTNSLIIANFGASNIVRWVLGDNKWTIVEGDVNGLNGNTSTLLDHPTGFTFDPMGNMYVADMFNHRIQMYPVDQTNGTTIAGISGQVGNNSTMLNYPVSVILDNQLNLYVSDSFNHRIQKFVRY